MKNNPGRKERRRQAKIAKRPDIDPNKRKERKKKYGGCK